MCITSSIYAQEDDTLFEEYVSTMPTSRLDYFPALVWYDDEDNLCVLFGSNFIIVDSWHYPAENSGF